MYWATFRAIFSQYHLVTLSEGLKADKINVDHFCPKWQQLTKAIHFSTGKTKNIV
jgi:hypothetical protein